jgi:4,4'-diaponeurosporenoate glycosyltransferase
MKWIPLAVIGIGILSGVLLFRRTAIPMDRTHSGQDEKISVIIPARNEAKNLPDLLESLKKQTLLPDEIIVVNDHSEDNTKEIAEKFQVDLINLSDLPKGWTGKNWAVWNGYLHSTGDILVFLDADIRLKPEALQALIAERKRTGGVISVVPYHITKRFYERFAMILNILGVFAFTSPFERHNRNKGLYGACIVAVRRDYERIGGHASVRSEMLDDLNLGARFQRAGIPVANYIGKGLVSFRMYPGGIKSELEGFAKGAVLSTSLLRAPTLVFSGLWLAGVILSELFPFFLHTPYFFPFFLGYLANVLFILYINKFVGQFGLIHPIFHFLSVIFFLVVLMYSMYQAVFRKSVVWKGRYVDVGRRK